MTELYTLMRYLQAGLLKDVGIQHFDEWAADFGEVVTDLELAMKNECHSIGFPLISVGIFGYPLDGAWRKAIQACDDFLKKHSDYDLDIIFAVLDDTIMQKGIETLSEIVPDNDIVKQSDSGFYNERQLKVMFNNIRSRNSGADIIFIH